MTERISLKVLASLALLATLAAGPARAELYKWVDDDGNVTYSQNPPPDRDATLVAPPPPPPDNPTAPVKSDFEQTAKDNAKREANQKQDQDLAKLNKENCAAARRNLEIYQTYSRYRDEKNGVVELDDKTRAAKLKETQAQIKEFCR